MESVKPPFVAAKFWAKVRIGLPDECWPWISAIGAKGYGVLTFERAVYAAHRVAFLLANGHWPNPQCLHGCDNPICCNPRHLSEGSLAENMRGAYHRGRHPRAKLTVADIPVIRAAVASGRTQRSVGEDYGVCPQQIGQIVLGRAWSHA
jgi:hypothetical protein